MASEANSFCSKDSLTRSVSSLFKSKDFFSDLYDGKDWDVSTISNPATDPLSTKAVDASILKSQEFIPKLVENMDWDTELCIEDVKATAQELFKQNALISSPEVAIPKPTAFADAFKSHDWSYMPGAIPNDIDYAPEMLEHALSPEEPMPVEKPTPDVFASRDWVLSEILGSHKDISLSPDMFHLDDVAAPEAPKEKTDWESFLIDQLAPIAPASCATAGETTPQQPKRKRKRKKRKKVIPDHKEYVTVSCHDVLLGRGGKSNHHPGNKRYREEIENFRPMYSTLDTDNQKTGMSQSLVDVIEEIGGRFLEEERIKDEGGKPVSLGWYVVPNIVARRKASQALREDNDPEKRKAKRARFLAKKKAMRGY